MKRTLLLALSFAAPLAAQTQPVPIGDYHLHMTSPAVMAVMTLPRLPAVEVPEELARVLRERERIVGNSDSTDLFTDDAQIVDINGSTHWLRGRAAVRASVGAGRPGYRVVPNAYEIHGDGAWIAASTVRGQAPALRYTSEMLLALRKGADGRWRIAQENVSLDPPRMFDRVFDADSVISRLDAAGIRRGAVLSVAYLFASPLLPPVADEQEKVREENDWTEAQVARYPDRLVGFCSVNPLRDYAIQELERCARLPHMRGLKLHFGNSGVNLLDPDHVERVRRVFAAANRLHLPIVAHLWTADPRYGREHSEIFLDRLVSAAPDVPIQVAHMGASGPGYHADEAIAVFAEAAAAHDPRVRNLWFDVATLAVLDLSDRQVELLTRRIRQIGTGRILFGSDSPGDLSAPPKMAWATFRVVLPLSDREIRDIAGNVPPYMR